MRLFLAYTAAPQSKMAASTAITKIYSNPPFRRAWRRRSFYFARFSVMVEPVVLSAALTRIF